METKVYNKNDFKKIVAVLIEITMMVIKMIVSIIVIMIIVNYNNKDDNRGRAFCY